MSLGGHRKVSGGLLEVSWILFGVSWRSPGSLGVLRDMEAFWRHLETYRDIWRHLETSGGI